MRIRKPHYAVPSEVKISRNGEYANIEYDDKNVSSVSMKVGPEIENMTDLEILDLHNSIIFQMEQMSNNSKFMPVEVPDGKPQIRYEPISDQWVPRGHVLRCIIEDGGPDYETSIWVDDTELTLREFGRLLSVFNGWGMRIVFVDNDKTHKNPKIIIKEPADYE